MPNINVYRHVKRGDRLDAALWNTLIDRLQALEQRVGELEQAGGGLPLIIGARSGGSGLAAATDEDTPRKGTATLRIFNGTTFVNGPQVEYYNQATGTNGAIAANRPLQLVRLGDKHLFASWESCPG